MNTHPENIPPPKASDFLPLPSDSISSELGVIEECDDADGYYKYRIGEIIDHYRINGCHGKGSFGIVLEAIDLRPEADNCKVAIKMAKNLEPMFAITIHSHFLIFFIFYSIPGSKQVFEKSKF